MATLQELTARLAALRPRRAGGLREVTAATGRPGAYRADAEMAAAIGDLEARIRAFQGPRINQVRINSSKGV